MTERGIEGRGFSSEAAGGSGTASWLIPRVAGSEKPGGLAEYVVREGCSVYSRAVEQANCIS